MSVIETFMLRDELDMLEVHLAELYDVVDWFVIVESRVTHTGLAKPMHLADSWERFAAWQGKIVRVEAEPYPGLGPWEFEHYQRDCAMQWLSQHADPGDVVIISDVDEFPPRGYDLRKVRSVVAFEQVLAMYAVDWLHPVLQRCTVAATWRYIAANGGLARVRDRREDYRAVRGGWHLTWLGGVEAQREKLAACCHAAQAEAAGKMTEAEQARVANGECYYLGVHHTGKFDMIGVEVDDRWPGRIFERKVPATWFRQRPSRSTSVPGVISSGAGSTPT